MYSNAKQRAAELTLHTLKLREELEHWSPVFPSAAVAPDSRLATWADLFGRGDGCFCPPCDSVHGPAAYLMDLFEFLKEMDAKAPVGGQSLLEVLFARRPDLKHLKLNCANAETPLPYIDLVIEHLESLLATLPESGLNATTPQTPETLPDVADVAARLRALPHEPEPPIEALAALYRDGGPLATAVYPWNLPFDRDFLQAGLYLKLIGVSPAEVLELMAKPGDGLHRARLGLSLSLWDRIARGSTAVANAWGLRGENLDQLVNFAGENGVLLARSGLAVDELFALLESPLFAGWNLHIDRASDPCDITHTRLMQRIGGEHARPSELSEVVRTEVFDLMHRVLRLRVALNWPMAKLQSALQALRIGRFSSAIDLVALSRMVALSVQRGVPLEKVAASLQTLDQALDEAPVDSAELAKAQAELAHAQADWLALLQLSAVDHAHLLALGLEDSLTPQEPGQRLERTADALETIALLTAASVDPAELHYLLRHQDLVPAVFMPRENDLEAQLDSVVAAIQNAGVEPPNLPALPADPTELERNRRREEEEARASALSELACLRLTAAEEQLRGITGITLINYVIADAPTGALLAATGTDRTRGVVHDFIALAALATDNSGYVGLRAASKLSLRRVLKTSRLFVMLKATVDDAKAMTGLTRDNTLWLDFNTLPLVPVTETASRPNLSTLKGLLQTSVTQRAMPPADRRLLQVIADATDAATTVADLESITGWGRSVSIPPSAGAWALGGVADLLEIAIVGDTPNWRSPDTYARLQIAIRWLQGHRLTVSPELIPPLNLLISAASGVTVDGLKALARSRFATDADWYKALTPAMDHLRAQQRDALLAHILNTNGHGWKTADDVYEHLLIDVQMGPCQLTSRIVQAHSAVQLFVQRCLMNLEKPEEVALGDVSDITEWRQWDWMKNYRVWEAGRKVFLYPENWIEPDLRDVKSPFFEELENELLQDEITPDMVERTVRTYLTKLHEVARLDIRALYEETYQERSGDGSDVTRKVIHMVGRTHAVPHIHYYRQRLDDLSWAPWEKLDLSIDADHLVLAVVNRRPMLFWPQFNEVQLDRNDPTTLALDMKLNWTTLEFGHWSAPTKSAESVRVDIKDRSTLMLRPEVTGARLTLHVYNLMRIPHPRENWPLGYGISIFAFSMDGCTADLKLVRLDRARALRLPRAVLPHNQLLKESVVSSSVTYLPFMDEGEPLGWLNPDSIAQLQEIAETGGLGGVIFAAFLAVALVHRDAAAYGESSVPLLNGPIEGFTLLPAHQFPRLAIGQPYVLTHSEHPLYAFQSPRSGWYLQPKYLLESGHHPFVCDLLEAVRSEGMDGLYRPAEITRVLFFPTRHQVVRPARPDRYPRQVERRNTERVLNDLRPNPFLVAESYPVDEFDFSTRGAYGIYNWELFFHIPLLLADRLSKNGRFADAQRWFHTIFDPTDVSPHPASQKYWRVKPLFAECESRSAPEAIRTLEEMMRRLSNGGADLEQQVEAWRNDPFNPHMLARMRLVAYMKTVVQKYIENLIAWADSLFRRDTMESINEATQLYVLGNHILGGAPVALPPMQRTARSYAELISEHSVDAFANVLIDIDISLPLSAARLSRSERPAAGVSMLYFCIPSNARLSELRTTIADRLFKIRHCMDIEGRTRQLALFAPPIDPALLVRARAAGLDIGTALSMALGARTPHYRFQPLLQKALEFCHEVRSFGNALLSALEKRDGEVLAQLHSRHEVGMLKRVSEIKRQQIEEAEAGLEGVHRSKSVVQARLDFFAGNLQAFTSPSETAQIADLDRAHNAELTSAALSLGASIAYAFPDIALGMTSFVKVGGTNIGNALRAGASIASIVAQQHTFDASMAGFKASHERRADEWRHQVETATRELAQIDQQIIAAEIRLNIAKQDQRNHEAQIADAEEVLSMQRDKFTNAQLYSWMSAQLAALHYQSYRMAFDLAKQAEAAADYELETGTLIRFDHWDAGRKGLLAGERLAQDLRRLETPYLDRNTRELEITKHVSLRQLDPVALIALRLSGQCTFHVPEALFDLDFPGHYFRRIKSVSMSVPCVAGPYTSVSGTLTLQESSIRRRPLVPEPKQLLSGPLQSIATSSGQNDGGLFELNFRDERYLPFEGRGAESTWQFSLPTKFRSFDYDTIADLVLHVRYTARDGDPEYSASVSSNLTRALNAISTEGLRILVSVRHDFPAEWRALQVEGDDARREIRIDASLFPYFVRESFDITAVHTITSGERVDPPLFINGSTSRTTTATVEISRLMEYLLVSYSIARDGV